MTDRRWYTSAEIERARRLRAGGYTLREIGVRMNRPFAGLSKLEARGWKRTTAEDPACPPDLSLQAAHLTVKELMRHYAVSHQLLRTWIAEKGIVMPKRQHRHALRPCPADFQQQAAVKGVRALCRHYHAACPTIRRWMIESGLPVRPSKHDPAPAPRIGWVERYVAEQRAGL